MSATEIIAEIQRLPAEERLEVVSQVLARECNANVERVLRKRRLAAFDELCAALDRSEHLGKAMTEEEIIELSLRE